MNKEKTTAKKTTAKKTTAKKTTAKKTTAKKTTAKKTTAKKTTANKTTANKTTTKGYFFYEINKNKKPKYFLKGEIPVSYSSTYLTALPRDPQWIFAYWEVESDAISSALKGLHAKDKKSAKHILRILDVTNVGENDNLEGQFFDIEVTDYATNWYINIPTPGKLYLVIYGILTASGNFIEIVASKPILAPRDSVSDIVDEKWTTGDTAKVIQSSGLNSTNNESGTNFFGSSRNSTKKKSYKKNNKNDSKLFPGSSDNFFLGSSNLFPGSSN